VSVRERDAFVKADVDDASAHAEPVALVHIRHSVFRFSAP
jgi:hypothetical protein